MAWDSKLGKVVTAGKGSDAPEDCEVCLGSGRIIIVKRHPWRVVADATWREYFPCNTDIAFLPDKRQIGWAVSASSAA